jgi:trehalose-phosphatase
MERLVAARPLLVALDFDGTLAHLVDNPDDARMTREARRALEQLERDPDITIALVSGRGLDSLRVVAEPDPGWWLIGSHGMEVYEPGGATSGHVEPQVRARRDALWAGFGAVAASFPGVWAEEKPWGVALHTRGVEADVERRAQEAARAFVASQGPDLTTRTGHGILETALGSRHKGDGLHLLHSALHPSCTLFVGDDLTDEDALAVLGPQDVGIRVGSGDTRARYRLGTPDEVAALLMELAKLRFPVQ